MTRGPWLLESVYRQHFKAVWRLLRRLGVPAAQLDDAAQDVFLVVQKKLPQLRPEASPQSWVFGITVRVASEYRRRSLWRRADPIAEDVIDPALNPGRQLEMQEAVALLHALLAQLDEKKREVFVLAELEQLSAPEIVEVLGVNLNTVYARLRAAKREFDAALVRRAASERRRRA